MTAKSRATLLTDIATAIVAGAPGSITVAEVKALLDDLVDSILLNIKEADITLDGKTGLAGAHPTALLHINKQRWQDAIRIYIEANDGSQQGEVLAIYPFPGAPSPELWIGGASSLVTKKNVIIAGTGSAGGPSQSMLDIHSDLNADDPAVFLRSSPLGGPHIRFINAAGVQKGKILHDATYEYEDSAIGTVFLTPDGRRVRLTVDNTPAIVLTDLTPGGLPSATPDASIATLVTDWNAAQPGVEFASFYATFAGVTADGGPNVTAMANLMGGARATAIPALAAVSGGPAWDAGTQSATFSGAQGLASPAVEYYRHNRELTIITWGVFPDTGSSYWPVALRDAGFTRWLGMKYEGGAPGSLRVGYTGGGVTDSTVAPSASRRLIAIDFDGTLATPGFAITIFNDARDSGSAGVPSSDDNPLILGGAGVVLKGVAVVYGIPNVAQYNVLKAFLDAIPLHAPVYA